MRKRRRIDETYVLAPGETLRGQGAYTVERYLTRGAFAAAYRARDDQGKVCFIKELLPPERPSQREELERVFQREVDVLRRLGTFEFVPRLWDAFADGPNLYLVTDFVEGEDLETRLRARTKLAPEDLVRWCVCLCNAVAYMHQCQVVHHDLKPNNIRINEYGDPVVLDYGAARWFRSADERVEELYGTDGFLAPEYAQQKFEDLGSGQKMDVFALGRILVELMVGERLSQEAIDRRQDQLYGSIIHNRQVDDNFVRAVFRSIAYDPSHRYNNALELAQEVANAAAPTGRVRPLRVDFGELHDTAPVDANLLAFNAGGGSLSGEAFTDTPWIEVGALGQKHITWQRNRQAFQIFARPDLVPPGAPVQGRVIVRFPDLEWEVPVTLSRAADLSRLQIKPTQLQVSPGGRAVLSVTNGTAQPVEIRFTPPPEMPVQVEPAQFTLPVGAKQDVAVTAAPEAAGGDFGLPWSVGGIVRHPVPVVLRAGKGGLLSAFRRK